MEKENPARGRSKFSTWRRNKTSEETNETSEEMFRLHVENVLFLKKVHSWEGVTEMVHGSSLAGWRVECFFVPLWRIYIFEIIAESKSLLII